MKVPNIFKIYHKILAISSILCLSASLSFGQAHTDPSILIKDEGVKQGYIQTLNCVGSGVSCTTSSGTGTLTASGGTPAGNNTEIQFNNSGAFGSSTDFTFDDSTNTLKVGLGSGGGGVGRFRMYNGGATNTLFLSGDETETNFIYGKLAIGGSTVLSPAMLDVRGGDIYIDADVNSYGYYFRKTSDNSIPAGFNISTDHSGSIGSIEAHISSIGDISIVPGNLQSYANAGSRIQLGIASVDGNHMTRQYMSYVNGTAIGASAPLGYSFLDDYAVPAYNSAGTGNYSSSQDVNNIGMRGEALTNTPETQELAVYNPSIWWASTAWVGGTRVAAFNTFGIWGLTSVTGFDFHTGVTPPTNGGLSEGPFGIGTRTVANQLTVSDALSKSDIAIDMNAYFTPTLQLNCEGSQGGTTITDSSANAFTPKANTSITTDTAAKKFGTRGCNFSDVNSSNLSYAGNTKFNFLNDNQTDYTISGWVADTSANTTDLIAGGDGTTNRLQYNVGQVASFLNLRYQGFNYSNLVCSTTISNTAMHWYVLFIHGTGSTKQIGLYVDGNQCAYTTLSDLLDFSGNDYHIGSRFDSFSKLQGYLDDFVQITGNPFSAHPNVGVTDTITLQSVQFSNPTAATHTINFQSGGSTFSSIVAAQADSSITVNKVKITQPATGSTLTIANGKTLTATNTVNLNTMTDGKACTYATSGTALNCNTTLGSGSSQTLSYQPGLLTAVNSNIGVYAKIVNASTVDNIVGSAVTFSCVVNPTITMYECGTSVTCASSPVTIGTVTVTAAGQAFAGSVSNSAITAGDYIGWAMTAGTCASIDVAANSQIHTN